jgi:hypothetical protein
MKRLARLFRWLAVKLDPPAPEPARPQRTEAVRDVANLRTLVFEAEVAPVTRPHPIAPTWHLYPNNWKPLHDYLPHLDGDGYL